MKTCKFAVLHLDACYEIVFRVLCPMTKPLLQNSLAAALIAAVRYSGN